MKPRFKFGDIVEYEGKSYFIAEILTKNSLVEDNGSLKETFSIEYGLSEDIVTLYRITDLIYANEDKLIKYKYKAIFRLKEGDTISYKDKTYTHRNEDITIPLETFNEVINIKVDKSALVALIIKPTPDGVWNHGVLDEKLADCSIEVLLEDNF